MKRTSSSGAVGSVRPGGRTAATQAAVFEATLAELVSHGYDETSVEAIAARAGVHKTTIYRRWQTKERLVAEALGAAADSRIDVRDSGDIDSDLRVLAQSILRTLASRETVALVRVLVSGAQASAMARQMFQGYWLARLGHVGPMVNAAVRRGQLPPGTDAAALMHYLAAPLFHRVLVTGEPLTPAAGDTAAAAALAAARAGVFVTSANGTADSSV